MYYIKGYCNVYEVRCYFTHGFKFEDDWSVGLYRNWTKEFETLELACEAMEKINSAPDKEEYQVRDLKIVFVKHGQEYEVKTEVGYRVKGVIEYHDNYMERYFNLHKQPNEKPWSMWTNIEDSITYESLEKAKEAINEIRSTFDKKYFRLCDIFIITLDPITYKETKIPVKMDLNDVISKWSNK